jgi:hypothetical protein
MSQKELAKREGIYIRACHLHLDNEITQIYSQDIQEDVKSGQTLE